MELGYILNEIPEDLEEQNVRTNILLPLKLRLQEGAMAELPIRVLYRTAYL